MDPKRRFPRFEIEDAGSPARFATDELDAASAEAWERGVSRAAHIPVERDMPSAAEFAKFIGRSKIILVSFGDLMAAFKAIAFEQPPRAERLKAIGPTNALSPALKRALTTPSSQPQRDEFIAG